MDLHVHSIYSDGLLSPRQLVEKAAANGLRAIALADHDTVEGIEEARSAGSDLGVEVISAVELSVEYQSYHDVHVLGYFIDDTDNQFCQKLALFCQSRDERGQAIIVKINEKLAWEGRSSISYDQILASAEGALGRPHIARALIAKGYARDTQDAFTKYLLPCNVPKLYFPMGEALAEIKRIGGIAVLAHPTSITTDRQELRLIIGRLAAMGLDGLEAYNNLCFNDDQYFLEEVARGLNLVITGGSDFHGMEKEVEMGKVRGSRIPGSLLGLMKGRLAKAGAGSSA